MLVAELDPTGANVLFSTPIGSNGLDYDYPAGLAVDSDGDIYVAGNTSGSKTFTVNIPVAGVSTTKLTFSAQNIGTTSAAQSVTLHNTGKALLTIASIATSVNFGSTNTCAGSVAPGGSCTIKVTFSPTATGLLNGTLTITDNSNAVAGTKQTVALPGTGLPAVGVALNPPSKSLALGGTQVFTATITNATNSALRWSVNGVQNGNTAQGALPACTTMPPPAPALTPRRRPVCPAPTRWSSRWQALRTPRSPRQPT